MLILEGQQAGLSWSTILAKRQHMRKAFDNFDPAILVTYGNNKIAELLQDPGIIRNRLKVNSLIENAKAYYKVKEKYGSLDNFLWRYVNFTPILNHWTEVTQVPAKTDLSDQISKDMKKLGFKFVGSTIIYAYMQAVGMVNDHITNCFLHKPE